MLLYMTYNNWSAPKLKGETMALFYAIWMEFVNLANKLVASIEYFSFLRSVNINQDERFRF